MANHHLSLLAHTTLWSWLINTVYRKAVQQQQGGGWGDNLINLAKKTVSLHNHSVQLCGNIHFSLYSIFLHVMNVIIKWIVLVI